MRAPSPAARTPPPPDRQARQASQAADLSALAPLIHSRARPGPPLRPPEGHLVTLTSSPPTAPTLTAPAATIAPGTLLATVGVTTTSGVFDLAARAADAKV